MPLLLGLLFALAAVVVDLAGDVVIKSAADRARFVSWTTTAGVGIYALAGICWYFTLRHIGLGQGAVFFSMLSLIVLVLTGVIWFGEGFGTRQVLGLGCAIAAMVLLSDAA